ncbi:MAG: 3-oxoadipate enol-lactonase, partial [Microbacteriaceae bacterium]|nr:3-oxoadipate enol-lactonase [Microbacteriaceae bacterium]
MSPVAVAHRVDGPEGAPLVVLSNSLGATRAMWEPQLPALTQRFRVVSYD